MYITVFELNKDGKTLRKIANRHEMHRDIQALFGESRNDCKSVYRIIERNGKVLLYIRSEKPVNKANAHFGMKFLGESVSPEYSCGEVHIDMLVTPIKTMRFADGKARKRPIYYTDKRIEWCKEKAPQYGFIIHKIAEVKREILHINKRDGKQSWNVEAYEYNIIGEIIDADLFNEALVSGFGRNGSYGAGMIIVA